MPTTEIINDGDEDGRFLTEVRIISSEIRQELKKRALHYTALHMYTHIQRAVHAECEARTNEAVYIGILFHSYGLLGERGLPITLKRQSRKSKCFYYSSSLM